MSALMIVIRVAPALVPGRGLKPDNPWPDILEIGRPGTRAGAWIETEYGGAGTNQCPVAPALVPGRGLKQA